MKKVIIEVDHLRTVINGELSEEVRQDLDNSLSYYVKDYIWSPKYNSIMANGKRKWDGRKHLFSTRTYRYYTGLFNNAKLILDKHGIGYSVVDKRVKPERSLDLDWNDKFKLRDYQAEVINNAVAKTRGIIKLATGGGKTLVVSRIIKELGVQPFGFFVLTKDLLYQSQQYLSDYLNTDIGIIGDGKCDIKPITVVSVQTVMSAAGNKAAKDALKKQRQSYDGIKAKDVEGNISVNEDDKVKVLRFLKSMNGMYADEAQHWSCSICEATMKLCPTTYYRFSGSATPQRDDNAEMTIQGLFGRYVCDISASYLIKKDYLVQPIIRFVDLGSQTSKEKNYAGEYKDLIVNNELRNNIIVNLTNDFYEQGLSCLILVKQIDHGNYFKNNIPNSEFLQGNDSSKKRNQAIDDIRNGDLKVLIATSLADEGLDIPSLDVLILAGSGKSSTRAYQRIGRVIRKYPNKKGAYVIDFKDGGKYMKRHSAARLRLYKKEELFIIENGKNSSKRKVDKNCKELF